ncbi:MAG: AraC family transcriptional regulator [Ignavibacteriales bacterium]|nr:AraC family transcriptional regulator [Ignavibacteriales bacterium]
MSRQHTLVNSQSGELAFKIFQTDGSNPFDHISRFNYYTIVWITNGCGTLKVDFSQYSFNSNTMMCFSPYQPFMLQKPEMLNMTVIHFHPDFFCIFKHQKEVACNGVLFNNIYEPPFIVLQESDSQIFSDIIEKMKSEMENSNLAYSELLISYLKIFLIHASRIKSNSNTSANEELVNAKEPFILQHVKDQIETHFKSKRLPSEYAKLLNISAKALNRIVKMHYDKTLSGLIHERITIEAKRELYLTDKTIKEIAHDLGFNDEYYFSRFFKNNTDVSPQKYRDTVGFDRAKTL